jgi:carboxymethylenebutenolidase
MGVLGFCRGGREALLFANRSREIAAVVAFHPAPVKGEEIARLRGVPVQVHHGTADRSVDAQHTRDLERMLRAQGTPAKAFLYEGADHGFLAYTRPTYAPDAAKLAWQRAIAFLKQHLR